MIIFILIGNKNITINCKKTDSILDIKKKINDELNLKNKDYWLNYYGKILLDNYIIGDFLNNKSSLFLKNRPMDIIKINSDNTYIYFEAEMMKKSNLKPILNFDSDIFDQNYKDYNYITYNIPKKYLNNKLIYLWYKLHKINLKTGDFIIKKPLSKFKFISKLDERYKIILDSENFKTLSKLNNLLGFLEIHFLFNLVSCYIAYKYFSIIDDYRILYNIEIN